jgi:hypothetical protein
MKNRFGYGLEKSSGDNSSKQHARALFLSLIPQTRADVVPNLFGTAYQPFLELLDNHREEILQIRSSLESELLGHPDFDAAAITGIAMRLFIPSRHALHEKEGAETLSRLLLGWSRRWNLAADWCLDYAVVSLREHYVESQSTGAFDTYSFNAAWDASGFEMKTTPLLVQYPFDEDLGGEAGKALNEFHFKYKGLDFKVAGLSLLSIAEFRREVRLKFIKASGKNVRGAGKALRFSVNSYIEKVSKVARLKRSLKQPPVKTEQAHFTWLIRWQVPECEAFRKIAKQYGVHWTTVGEGVQATAKWLGLKLRSRRIHSGRPAGSVNDRARYLHRVVSPKRR